MKYLLNILISAVLAAVTCSGLSAQEYTPVPVTISKEKVKVDGRIYYSHIVLERQTLYSICKAYGVTLEQLYEANPALKENGLKKNAIILIPAADVKKNVSDRKLPKDYIIHTVKWYEDLDVIAGKYGVTVEAIMNANGLTGRKLSRRQKLRIPMGPVLHTAAADSVSVADTSAGNATPAVAADKKKDKLNAVLLMPFNASGEKPRTGSIDFYCGMLMAVKQIGDSGISIDLSVYDIDGGLPSAGDKIGESDIIIGPVSASSLSDVMAICPINSGIVSPLDHKAEYLAGNHSNFIQAPTSTLVLYEDLARWIKEERKDTSERVVVIYEKGSRKIEEMAAMNTILEKDGIPFSSFSYSILEGRDIQEPLMGMMSMTAPNRVLVMSESEAFVNDVVRNLNLLIHSEYDIVLYGPSKIRSFETIEVDNLHNTGLHTSVAYFVDYESLKVKDFVKKYRALYNTEPTPYAFQGYDIASYFLGMCAKYGEDWERHLETDVESLLQADFKFVKAGEKGGFVNTGARRIVYGPDYTITLCGDGLSGGKE